VAVTTRVLGARIQTARRADLEATSSVTGILRDVFHGVTVLRLHDAREAAVAEVARRCEARRHTAVRDRILTEGISAAALSSVDLAIGLVLVVAAGSLGSDEFTVGDCRCSSCTWATWPCSRAWWDTSSPGAARRRSHWTGCRS
jgi:ABC-type multidrug transport system fused ATPase/permease subunit